MSLPPWLWEILMPVIGAVIVVVLQRLGIKIPGAPQPASASPLGPVARKVEDFRAMKEDLRKLRKELEAIGD